MKKSRWQSLRFPLALFFVLTVFTGIQAHPVYADGPSGQMVAKYLVLISVDSCRPDYLTLVPTPNIDKLKSEGTFYTNSWVGQLSNDTPPGHTTMSAGSFGKNTGVISFNWRDTRALPSDWEFKLSITKMVLNFIKFTGWTDLGLWYQQNVVRKTIEENFITSYENVASGFFTNYIRSSGSTSIGSLYKKANPGARVVAISCDKWYACAGLVADGADNTVFAEAKGVGPVSYNLVKHLKPAGVAGMLPPDYIMNDASFIRDVKDERDTDTWATDAALKIIENDKPEILLINLPATDDAGHACGGINAPQKMGEIIANVDKQIGRIVDEYKKIGRYDDTLWVIISDHGMTPLAKKIPQSTIDKLLVESGNFSNASAHIYLMDQQGTQQVAEKITGAGIPGLMGAYYRVQAADGKYSYQPTKFTASSITGDLDRCYRYLLDTYAGSSSPDIELILVENCHIDWTMFNGKPFVGNHDCISWLQQHNILLFTGPGVNKGIVSESPARLADVAPTVLTLMGVVPQKMDGVVLADALQSPTSRQEHAQIAVSTELLPLLEALKAQSVADLAKK